LKTFRKITYGIAFFSPLLGETDLIVIGGVKIPAVLSILFFIAAFFLSRKKDLSFLFRNKIFIYAILYLLVIFLNYAFVLHDLFFKVYEELTPLWISIFRRLITVMFIFFAFRDESEAMKLFYFYCGGLVLSSLAAYPEMFVIKHHLFSDTTVGNEGYQRAIGFFSNPNDFALTTVIAAIFIYHRYLLTHRRIYLIITLLLIPPVFLSFSRNGLACLFLATFLVFNLGKKIKLRTILYISFSFIALVFTIYYIPSIRERVLLLFSGDDSSAIGRYLVIYAAYQKWLTMPFWGIGVLSSPLLMAGMGNEGLLITIHNFYAHALFESGIIGFIIVMLFLLALYKSYSKIFRLTTVSKTVKQFERAGLIALIVTYFYIFSGNHINFEYLWYLIGVQLVIMRSIKIKNAKEQEPVYEEAFG
jgi:O-antigen ligase